MSFFEIVKAIIYGIVEGITEWLPVSSTGHLILLNQILPMKVSPEFWSMFLVVVQLGAILAVVIYFWHKIWPFNTKVKNKPFIRYDVMNLWVKIIVACIPAAIVGVLFDDWIDQHFYKPTVVSTALIVVGVVFILVENNIKKKNQKPRVTSLRELSYVDAIVVGLFQLVAAVFPGTSRSGATIIGGLIKGIDRTVTAEFTFFLAIPVMFGSSLLKLLGFGFSFTWQELIILLVGCIAAFGVSMASIKFLMNYVKNHDFKIFGYYRIVLGLVVLIYFALA